MSRLFTTISVRWRLGVAQAVLVVLMLSTLYYTVTTAQATAENEREITGIGKLTELAFEVQLLASQAVDPNSPTDAPLPETLSELNTGISALLDGSNELGFYDLHRLGSPAVIPAYDALVEANNGLSSTVTRFIAATAADRLTILPAIHTSSNALRESIAHLLTLVSDETQMLVQNIVNVSAAVTVLIIIVALFGATIGYQIVRRLSVLNAAARKLSSGEFSTRVQATERDEIGQIALAMNAMAEELEAQIGSLEQRISVRTRDLQTVADVNRQIATILDVNRLLQDVVDLTKERFRLYHAHIYVLDETGNTLILRGGAGYVGRQMVSEVRTIALDNQQSIVARAAYTRRPMVVNDVTISAVFLPHPLLPDTRAELAVPLVARGQLLGVLDVQADQSDFFSADSAQVFELMAGQVAAALSNASLYESAERTSRHERALGNIDRRIQGALDVDEVMQVTVRELGKALRVPHTAIELQMEGQDAAPETNYEA